MAREFLLLRCAARARCCSFGQTTVRVGSVAARRSRMRRLIVGITPGSRSSSVAVEVDFTPVLFPRIENLHSRQCRRSYAYNKPRPPGSSSVAAYVNAVPRSRTAVEHAAQALRRPLYGRLPGEGSCPHARFRACPRSSLVPRATWLLRQRSSVPVTEPRGESAVHVDTV